MSESSSTHVDPEDTMNILVATDIHLGFDYSKKRGLFLFSTNIFSIDKILSEIKKPDKVHLKLIFNFFLKRRTLGRQFHYIRRNIKVWQR